MVDPFLLFFFVLCLSLLPLPSFSSPYFLLLPSFFPSPSLSSVSFFISLLLPHSLSSLLLSITHSHSHPRTHSHPPIKRDILVQFYFFPRLSYSFSYSHSRFWTFVQDELNLLHPFNFVSNFVIYSHPARHCRSFFFFVSAQRLFYLLFLLLL